eukprot:TRINITY_DN7135_c0_g1_i2.p1 TRINITY_DN7135_c0_g1~~TRINITY_DN7135_c0_g1_i2.p1  ORF type:complete len:665 (+),score=228.99 TRINITY_DN7135_c0_g1_i2:54-2048(+)
MDHEIARRRIQHLKTCLEPIETSAAAPSPSAPASPYADLPLFGISGRLGFGQRITIGWHYLSNGVRGLLRARRADNTPGFTIVSLFEEALQQWPDNTAIKFENVRYTYRQVEEAANAFAHWARAKGVAKGQVVALMMENRPEFIFTWLGLAKIGAVTAFVNYRLHGKSLAHVMRISNAILYIVGSELVGTFNEVSASVSTPTGASASSAAFVFKGDNGVPVPAFSTLPTVDADLPLSPTTRPDASWREGNHLGSELWYIYTSGTTGLPKAARVVHRNVYQRSTMLSFMLRCTSADTMYCALPLYHSSGSVISLSMWHVGGAIALRRSVSVKEFWSDCVSLEATMFIYIGEVCRYLLMQPDQPNDRAHKVRLAIGNGMNGDVWAKFQRRFQIPQIVEFYGSTEGNAMLNLANKIGAVGYVPYFGTLMLKNRIIQYDVDKDEHVRTKNGLCVQCSSNEVGELVSKIEPEATLSISSGGQFVGYTDQSATDKKILHNVLEKGDMYFRTGDLLRMDEDGFYYFVDRIGDTFRWKGENVSTNEVAEVLSCFPGIEEAAVFGVQVQGYEGRAGMASLVLKSPAETFPWAELYTHLEHQLPAYARPIFIRVQKEIPKTSTFKYQKTELVTAAFHPDKVHGDPLLFLDDKQKTFVPLGPALHGKVLDGSQRL